MAEQLRPGLERRLKAEVSGGVSFDRFTRGRYATDASHYQIMLKFLEEDDKLNTQLMTEAGFVAK